MEPSYSEWKPVVDAEYRYKTYSCGDCDCELAQLMKRFYTNRDGESEAEFQVQCPICGAKGKVYHRESTAVMSWNGREHDPNRKDPFEPKKKRRHQILR